MTTADRLPDWPATLRRTLETNRTFRRALVIAQVGSTQDAARAHGRPGDVIVADRQTAGRGTHGRAWLDTPRSSLAFSFCLDPIRPERLSIALGIAVAHAIEQLGTQQVGVKWPNDVQIDGRKVAGILVEQAEGIAIVGIGVNVGAIDWPAELHGRAVSLADGGLAIDRIDVLSTLVASIDMTLHADDDTLTRSWTSLDLLTGSEAAFRVGHRRISGLVERIDPMQGLSIATADGPQWLPAHATTRVDPLE